MKYTYTVLPRPAHLGGGWNLRLLEGKVEVGGGVFPAGDDVDEAYMAAVDQGEDWLSTQPQDDE